MSDAAVAAAVRAAGALRRIGRIGRVLPALVVIAIAAGCATVGGPPPPADDSAAGFALVAGRFALAVTDAGHPPRRSNARFETEGDERAGRLLLLTPIGTTLAEARWSPGEVTLATSDARRRFDSLEALAHELLGEPLPLQALVHWLRGRPWPGAPSVARTDGVAGFEQLGWRIDLSARRDGGIAATRGAPPPAVDLRVRLDTPSP